MDILAAVNFIAYSTNEQAKSGIPRICKSSVILVTIRRGIITAAHIVKQTSNKNFVNDCF